MLRGLAPRGLARWTAIAVLGALAGVALHLHLAGGVTGPAPVTLVAVDRAPGDATEATHPSQLAGAPVGPASDAPSAPDAGAPVAPGAPAPSGAAAAPPAGSPDSTAAERDARPATSLVLRIPALGVHAGIVPLGFDADGQLDVPTDGASVGWYDISPRPGEVGNALLGAHFDWDGELAVFAGLSRLAPGDRLYIAAAEGELVYEVSVATTVGWDHPVADILAAQAPGSSLTLFTCGGAFDSERGEYDERVIVRAVQVDPSEALAARP